MTINTIPQVGASFNSDLQTFLQEEDADRFRDILTGFIVSGGTHGTGASLTQTPASLTAYPGGHYITETGSITYPDDTTHIWVICHKDTTTAVTNWTRESGTHYLFRNTGSASTPALPVPESAILMKVTTASGSVTVVQDSRILSPLGNIGAVTDNALSRYDGTSGNILQNSGIIVDDSDNITGINNLTAGGTITYNSKTLALNVVTGNFTRTSDTASGDVPYASLGGTPVALWIDMSNTTSFVEGSKGFTAGVGTDRGLLLNAGVRLVTTQLVDFNHESGNTDTQRAVLKSFDADGFTLTWTKAASPPSETLSCNYIALLEI